MQALNFIYGDALLFATSGMLSYWFNFFLNMLSSGLAYVVHIHTNFPFLHFGHIVMSLPYFSSIRWLMGTCTFWGSVPKFNCCLMALSRFVLP